MFTMSLLDQLPNSRFCPVRSILSRLSSIIKSIKFEGFISLLTCMCYFYTNASITQIFSDHIFYRSENFLTHSMVDIDMDE